MDTQQPSPSGQVRIGLVRASEGSWARSITFPDQFADRLNKTTEQFFATCWNFPMVGGPSWNRNDCRATNSGENRMLNRFINRFVRLVWVFNARMEAPRMEAQVRLCGLVLTLSCPAWVWRRVATEDRLVRANRKARPFLSRKLESDQ